MVEITVAVRRKSENLKASPREKGDTFGGDDLGGDDFRICFVINFCYFALWMM